MTDDMAEWQGRRGRSLMKAGLTAFVLLAAVIGIPYFFLPYEEALAVFDILVKIAKYVFIVCGGGCLICGTIRLAAAHQDGDKEREKQAYMLSSMGLALVLVGAVVLDEFMRVAER